LGALEVHTSSLLNQLVVERLIHMLYMTTQTLNLVEKLVNVMHLTAKLEALVAFRHTTKGIIMEFPVLH
jgi:hypothetical protein